jgi:hypothetical protein
LDDPKKIALISATFLLASFSLSFAQQQHSFVAELTIAKKYPSSGYFPLVKEYVQYNVTIKNTGDIPIENQSLWAYFVSDDGKSSSSGKFSIGKLGAGESKTLYLGPFKMLSSSQHYLYLGINSKGDSDAPNEVAINYSPKKAADSFYVYSEELMRVLPITIGSLLTGAIALGIWTIKRRSKKESGTL